MMKEKYMNNFDRALDEVGADGRYQKYVVLLGLFPITFIYASNVSNGNLLMTSPDHWCHVPCQEKSGMTKEQWKNATIPWEESNDAMSMSSCWQYVPLNESENCAIEQKFSNTTTKCLSGWRYDQSTWTSTPVSEFGMVCDNKHMVTFIFSGCIAANAIGTFVFSALSDRYGRLPIIYASGIINFVFGIASIFSRTLIQFAVMRLLLNLAYYSVFQMSYIIIMELCATSYRSFGSMMSFIGFYVGIIYLSFLVWILGNWRIYLWITHLPSILFLLAAKLLPESPRWLLSRGKVDECEAVLKKIAKINGKTVSSEMRELLEEAAEEEKNKASISDIIKCKTLLKRSIIMCYLSSVCNILLYGISLNIHNMTGSEVVNYALLGVVQIPTQFFGTLSITYLGRKLTHFWYSTGAAVMCLVITTVLENHIGLMIGTAFFTLFVGSMDLTIYVTIGELFPTPSRALAYGITAVVALAVSTLVPPLLAMGSDNKAIPYFIMAGIAMSGALVSTLLPETFGCNLPQTTEEAEAVGSEYPFYVCVTRFSKKSKKSNQ